MIINLNLLLFTFLFYREGDSVLIVPCPVPSVVATTGTVSSSSTGDIPPVYRNFAHLKAFISSAESSQIVELLKRASSELLAYMQKHPNQRVWWSTSGLGVYYLHMRLDPRPKYYNWTPYKS